VGSWAVSVRVGHRDRAVSVVTPTGVTLPATAAIVISLITPWRLKTARAVFPLSVPVKPRHQMSSPRCGSVIRARPSGHPAQSRRT
jgi:hypothetical protein